MIRIASGAAFRLIMCFNSTFVNEVIEFSRAYVTRARPYHPRYLGRLCLLHIYIPRGLIRSGTVPRKNVHRVRPVNLYSITVQTNVASDEK